MDTIGKGKQSSDGDWLVVGHWSEVFRLLNNGPVPLQCAVELLLISGVKQSHVVHHEKLSVQFSCFLWFWWQCPRKSLHWQPLFITCSHIFLLVICCSLYPLREADWFVDIFKTFARRPSWLQVKCEPSRLISRVLHKMPLQWWWQNDKIEGCGHCCPQFPTSAPASTLLWATQLFRGARANTNLT